MAGQLYRLIKAGSRCTFMSEYYNAMSVREQVSVAATDGRETGSLSEHPLYAINHFHGYGKSQEKLVSSDPIKSFT